MAKQRAEQNPAPAGSGPEDEPVPSAEQTHWRTSPDDGPPVPDDAYVPPEVPRGVSN
jgi:hypothetical protein